MLTSNTNIGWCYALREFYILMKNHEERENLVKQVHSFLCKYSIYESYQKKIVKCLKHRQDGVKIEKSEEEVWKSLEQCSLSHNFRRLHTASRNFCILPETEARKLYENFMNIFILWEKRENTEREYQRINLYFNEEKKTRKIFVFLFSPQTFQLQLNFVCTFLSAAEWISNARATSVSTAASKAKREWICDYAWLRNLFYLSRLFS